MKTITLKIPESLDEEIIKYAKSEGFSSRSDFIRYAIRVMLRRDIEPIFESEWSNIKSEIIEQIEESREYFRKGGKGISLEKVKEDLELK
jgi:Arc/MetJ-type ribon-helix-helix transcriptional regulator